MTLGFKSTSIRNPNPNYIARDKNWETRNKSFLILKIEGIAPKEKKRGENARVGKGKCGITCIIRKH